MTGLKKTTIIAVVSLIVLFSTTVFSKTVVQSRYLFIASFLLFLVTSFILLALFLNSKGWLQQKVLLIRNKLIYVISCTVMLIVAVFLVLSQSFPFMFQNWTSTEIDGVILYFPESFSYEPSLEDSISYRIKADTPSYFFGALIIKNTEQSLQDYAAVSKLKFETDNQLVLIDEQFSENSYTLIGDVVISGEDRLYLKAIDCGDYSAILHMTVERKNVYRMNDILKQAINGFVCA